MCHLVPILTSLEMTCRDGVEGTLFERGQLANQLFNAIMRFSELHTLKLCTTTSEPFLDHAGHYGGLRNPTALPITASLLESITAHHPHLKILHFSLGGKGGWIEPTFVEADIDDSDIERLARNLPRLSSFEFCVTAERKSKLSAASLVALGTHCRALERLLFIPNVDLRALDHLRERPLFPNLTNWDVGFSESFRATEGTSPAIAFLDFHCPRLRTIGGRYLALSRRPWELVKYFTVGPNCLNGFDLREEMWDDGYGSYYYSMPRGSTPSVIESEPSVWGNELFESDEASTDEEEQSCSCSGSECGSDCSGYDSETRDRR
ncbi:uncharacterized protein BDZ99DRAFT_479248 [Mytilinidion resinicola]|uniref:F-box domain-containing protein n=1 Tax=Mytilinidion resinicola TaxID=574789 RepID=A0A6A6YE45_9PEZI|nr:uncharacterized protein BDZ99DRAFT_479248 [Mytilinidion resinicola]KAF2806869.1 hypothetical protein BDZ99DRAFT_479248 [Mytilinidion resinicola]